MNKQDVVSAVAQKTGLQPAVCEKIVNAIEEQAPGALASEFLGNQTRHAEIVSGIAANGSECGGLREGRHGARKRGKDDGSRQVGLSQGHILEVLRRSRFRATVAAVH